MMNKSLKGKTVWITGGKRIGQAVAEELASLGANIIASYRSSQAEAEELIEKAQRHGVKTRAIQCDVGSRESVAEAAEILRKEFGHIDILVLMASVFRPVALEKISDQDFDSNFDAHVKGTFWPIQLCLPLMKPGSHIITISDRTAIGKVYSGYLPYAVTKSAVAGMTRALAAELGPRGIFINSIAPGPILKPDDITDQDWQDIRSESMVNYPITDKEAVQEFVDTVVRLSFIRSSGSIYPLDLGHL